jgi:ABC-type phosphate transport system substrate-binding protein
MEDNMNTKGIFIAIALVGTLSAPRPASAQAVKVDSSIKGYAKTADVSGNLNSIGSDTLNNLMTLWAEAFPEATIEGQDPDRRERLVDGASGAHLGTAQLGR